jgi:hypothetical protein
MDPAALIAASPLKARAGSLKLPKYFTLRDVSVWDMSTDARRERAPAPRPSRPSCRSWTATGPGSRP